jgi:hypothetical protein
MSVLDLPVLKPAQIALRRTIVRLVVAFVGLFKAFMPRRRRRGGGSSGLEWAGKPVPWRPSPTHHLVAAKALPPLEKTYLLAKD